MKNVFICQHGTVKIKLETSSCTPSHTSWPCNSALQITPLGLREYCHLPVNFKWQAYYLATNGNSFMQFTLLLIASHWSIHVCPWLRFDLSVFFFFLPKIKDDVQVKKYIYTAFLLFFAYVHWSQRGQWEGVRLLKSTTPICLSVRCLAWLSSTQWWCWQNDRRGAHSSECQFSCRALLPQKHWSSHTPKQKKESAVVCRRKAEQN